MFLNSSEDPSPLHTRTPVFCYSHVKWHIPLLLLWRLSYPHRLFSPLGFFFPKPQRCPSSCAQP